MPEENAEECLNFTNSTTLCITTNQLDNISQDSENISIVFTEGNHWLYKRYAFVNISSLYLIGNNGSVITCQEESGLRFENIENLIMENLIIKGNQSEGGAVFVRNIDMYQITRCIFYNNKAFMNGGAIHIEHSDLVLINDCMFLNNSVHCTKCNGGALDVFNTNTVWINRSSFQGNTASFSGGAISSIASQLSITDSTFTSNFAKNFGGAISSLYAPTSVSRSIFKQNSVILFGGAIGTVDSVFVLEEVNFTSNDAKNTGGAIFAVFSIMWITQSTYINNTSIFGGSISMFSSSNVSIQKSYFEGNFGKVGGAAFVNNSKMHSTSTVYIHNNALVVGGAIAAFETSGTTEVLLTNDEYIQNFATAGGVLNIDKISLFVSENCTYKNNSATSGGAIFATNTIIQLKTSIFIGNSVALSNLQQTIFETENSVIGISAVTGGAITVNNCSVLSLGTQYIRNKATHFSGAIFAEESDLNIVDSTFELNEAESGAAFYAISTKATVANCTFTSNRAFNNSILSALSAEIDIVDEFLFHNNSGSISAFESTLRLKGEAILTNNNGNTGGAIDAIQSRIEFTESSTVTIRKNRAIFGGAISLIETICTISSSNVTIEFNTATENGGGIYAIQSQLEITPREIDDTITIAHNKADLNGGGFHVIASQTKLFQGHLLVNSNHACERGGAFYLESNSKIYINKMKREIVMGKKNVILSMVHNTATIGGAVYIEDTTNTGSLCRKTTSDNQQPLIPVQCFLQTIQLYPNLPLESLTFTNISGSTLPQQINTTTSYNNVLLANNTAKDIGSAIYGGLLDRCAINPLSELSKNEENITLYNGFDYIKLLAEFQGLVDYKALRIEEENYPINVIQSVSKEKVSNLIASEAVKVCFCIHREIDCDYTPSTIFTKKGETFLISLTAVDQLENPTKANLISNIQSASGIHRLKEGQGIQVLNNTCTEIKYNVFASDNSAQLEIHADGPCRDFGISMRTININFTTCTCPVGFIPSPSDIECICLCHNQLINYVDETKCIAENKSISMTENVWIGLTILTNNESDFVVQNCPFDYCVQKPFTLVLDEQTIDEQCNHNRTGYLCGRCKEGLSQVFGSSKCDKCTNFFLFLLIPFALAGIALVALILMLNMTVAIGTTNGLIFYANILAANHSIFLQGSALNIFIAWINLDLGIGTCFYNGMDTYSKFLLQLVFPAYIFILVAAIIIASQYSKRISDILGKKNPIATLSTLILLSYSKLLSMIIESLQFTTLQFSENTAVVWLLDANVPYVDPSHIPRFIIATLVTVIGLVYTILLLFAQCFHSCPNKRLLKWLRNPKYNAFIDAYHAPFTPNSRYWVGLLLMLRIIHFVTSAVATKAITVLSVGCIAFFILSIRVMSKKVYKLWPNNVLENLFIINLGLLAIFTYFVMLTNGQQSTITDISLAIAFTLFSGITCYHLHEYVLKSTKFYRKQVSKIYTMANKLRGVKRGHKKTTQQLQDNCGYRDEAITFGNDNVISTESSLSIQISSATFSVIDKPNYNYTQDE